jgi:hypothetical protein
VRVHAHLEDVGPVVVAREIVAELHLDSDLEVEIGIDDALAGAEGPGEDAAVGGDDQELTT